MPKLHRDADQHGDERGDDRAVDRRDGAELLGDRVPDLGGEEAEAEGLNAGTTPMISDTMTPPSRMSTRTAAAKVAVRKTASPILKRRSALRRLCSIPLTASGPLNATSVIRISGEFIVDAREMANRAGKLDNSHSGLGRGARPPRGGRAAADSLVAVDYIAA